jgi:hypothetical protein
MYSYALFHQINMQVSMTWSSECNSCIRIRLLIFFGVYFANNLAFIDVISNICKTRRNYTFSWSILLELTARSVEINGYIQLFWARISLKYYSVSYIFHNSSFTNWDTSHSKRRFTLVDPLSAAAGPFKLRKKKRKKWLTLGNPFNHIFFVSAKYGKRFMFQVEFLYNSLPCLLTENCRNSIATTFQ